MKGPALALAILPLGMSCWFVLPARGAAEEAPDFNRDIRPILSNNCFYCHGPDDKQRKGGKHGLRLDTADGQKEDLGGYSAVVPGNVARSKLVERICTKDADDLMPPGKTGKKLSAHEIDLLKRWIAGGGKFSRHWSYEPPVRPALPKVSNAAWPRSGLDYFVLAKLDEEKLKPQAEADRYALARRLSLDLTGLPPSVEEVDAFVKDAASDAYERYVDRLLAKDTYGEHWARMWLDLARYADSAGYADDPPRVIWAYRDYVIQAFNRNTPFDQFTTEQLAGDLLPHPTQEQIVATAFHRNTMTNNEGGTVDEEFRNAAIVDRVNTTMAVWMGTSMACAQCHSHKFDPITQTEYFRFFAFFNNTADSDKRDENPFLEFYSDETKRRRADLEREFQELEARFRSRTPELVSAAAHWAKLFPTHLNWEAPRPTTVKAQSGAALVTEADGSLSVPYGAKQDTYTVELPFDSGASLTALRLESLGKAGAAGPQDKPTENFVVTSVHAQVIPVPNQAGPVARYVRVEVPGTQKFLQLAEVQVFSNGQNVALQGKASQSSTYDVAVAQRAIDGNTDGRYATGSVAHTNQEDNPWWEVDLQATHPVERIVVWNRAEEGGRLQGYRVQALDEQRHVIWEKANNPAPETQATFALTGAREVEFRTVVADFTQKGYDAAGVLGESETTKTPKAKKALEKGWAVGGAKGKDHSLTLLAKEPVTIPPGATLLVTIEQKSKLDHYVLQHFKLAATGDARVAQHLATPPNVLEALAQPEGSRNHEQTEEIVDYFVREVAPELKTERKRLATLQRDLDAVKPDTVPVMKELSGKDRRKTFIQVRGNYQVTTDEVQEGVPGAWNTLPTDAPKDRLTVAHWLMSRDNPLTARVIANRFWEQIFGVGIVRTSEEFGSQGELPVNQPLLDWLAVELMDEKWNIKQFIKLLVTSAAYRQSSHVTAEAHERDPDNRFLSHGPRFRMSAEMLRDQALAVSGLLSAKMYGPSVRPARPNLGLSAAFGGGLDWQTSSGEDRYRRGLYTEWRRTSPYPSMAAFDAPNREVCTIRRNRTNTPLQALVTLNDPVFVEAAQALARRMAAADGAPADKLSLGFRRCLSRTPGAAETRRLLQMHDDALAVYSQDAAQAKEMATNPLGPAPDGASVPDLAAWTTVANVLLNLDEILMKR